MDKKVEIGKFTLESLTTGMYSDPLIVYREYIQNSVDALEAAVKAELIDSQYMRIDIIVDDDNNNIIIQDNGIGLKSDVAVSRLVSVGASTKSHSENRGFRGIGRLGGLSYCSKLVFVTSAYGDEVETTVSFDCDKLKELLVPGKYENMTMQDVLNKVTNFTTKNVSADSHYFKVELFDIISVPLLMDLNIVESYISQVAPVPYYKKRFIYSSHIKQKMIEYGIEISEFPIYLGSSLQDVQPVYKPNRSRYVAGRSANSSHDEILDIRFFDVKSEKGELLCAGWHGVSNWLGTIADSDIKGIRFRKGNIQIGDSRTLNSIFKQDRFNGWSQGEIFVCHNNLIPNARRDDFEQTGEYYKLESELTSIVGDYITEVINIASKARNNPIEKKLLVAKQTINNTERAIETGYNSKIEKERLIEDIDATISKISTIPTKSKDIGTKKKEIMDELKATKEKLENDNNYKISKINSSIGKKEKKVLSTVSEILTTYLTKELLDAIMEEIINTLNNK